MIKELYFATGNKNKAEETEDILGIPIKVIDLDIDEIQSLDLEKILRKKAQTSYDLVKKPLIVDDVGLYVDVWRGFPGPFIKYLLDENGFPDLILRMLGSETNRKVLAKVGIGYHDGNQVQIFIGEVAGELTLSPKGERGWGWDSIFIPQGYNQTFAELGPEIKNKISHRREALEKLRSFLHDRYKTISE